MNAAKSTHLAKMKCSLPTGHRGDANSAAVIFDFPVRERQRRSGRRMLIPTSERSSRTDATRCARRGQAQPMFGQALPGRNEFATSRAESLPKYELRAGRPDGEGPPK